MTEEREGVRPTTDGHRFFIGFAAITVAVMILGFGRSYYAAASQLAPMVHVHAIVSGAWVILFAAQVWLAASGRIAFHRQLGVLAALLVLVVLGVGLETAIEGARGGYMGPRLPRDVEGARHFLFMPLGNLLWFATLVVLGILNRSKPESHKRFMVLAMLGGMLPPALARLPVAVELILILVLTFGPLVYERVLYGRVHRVFAWGMTLMVASIPVTILVSRSTAWARVADWLIG